ncbi:MAG: plastocyanin/azurin family copper-binding protein [Actinomycetota bacterium]|nr:plastocyanin/azurin family copper-binding protein [Actinomycetota bacterium]
MDQHDSTEHTATANNGTTFDTGPIQPGQTKTFTFTTAGTYGYHCSLHPFMTGTVIVK